MSVNPEPVRGVGDEPALHPVRPSYTIERARRGVVIVSVTGELDAYTRGQGGHDRAGHQPG
jgi:hypothetical protein